MTAKARPFFDAHFHVIDSRFPLVEQDGYLPADFTVRQYRERTAALDVAGGAVVSGSFQGFDQTCLLDALSQLGPGFVGVTQIPHDLPDEQVALLAERGVRGVRFNLRRGGSARVEHLDTLARRVHDVAGMHIELYADARDLPGLAGILAPLPAVSVDHLGLHPDGLPCLLELVERGVRVKATGFGRVERDVPQVLRAVLDVDPTALMAGTDLPSTRAPRPFAESDLELLAEVAGEHLDGVMYGNAAAFYRV
ncbi:2-pyrone-4,6-dicarboxylate hydrolase [Streptomyces spongiicola]|uniref:2-pyrone-4,6-dicarboxylate hydrolase n=1 Tax=Streptomyces spongiicola TaxID=1690221 RepID=A0A2S1Z8E5_9ACTN|nr:amidohydrolase family protein [Streptomyces spongiicola]AWK12543.1 2-pyrone-4,6-dicarboxylate hydrolase [Streptomyces spongiicola]GBP99614.1 2-pyrone-4,6-dicarboxylate hydrolase [Streptomyces spongiicola]